MMALFDVTSQLTCLIILPRSKGVVVLMFPFDLQYIHCIIVFFISLNASPVDWNVPAGLLCDKTDDVAKSLLPGHKNYRCQLLIKYASGKKTVAIY